MYVIVSPEGGQYKIRDGLQPPCSMKMFLHNYDLARISPKDTIFMLTDECEIYTCTSPHRKNPKKMDLGKKVQDLAGSTAELIALKLKEIDLRYKMIVACALKESGYE